MSYLGVGANASIDFDITVPKIAAPAPPPEPSLVDQAKAEAKKLPAWALPAAIGVGIFLILK